jgi:hypothetical protein
MRTFFESRLEKRGQLGVYFGKVDSDHCFAAPAE